jgi:hypothetical protein
MKLKRYNKKNKKKLLKKYAVKKFAYFSTLNNKINLRYLFKKKKRFFSYLSRLYKVSFKKKISTALLLKPDFLKKINIKVVQNNIFCTLINLRQNKTIHNSSSGVYNIKISKRKLKHFYKDFLIRFFKIVRHNFKTLNNTFFSIIAPIKRRRNICKLIKNEIKSLKKKKFNILIKVEPKKCFNGCRSKKQLRKKRRLYRIYK